MKVDLTDIERHWLDDFEVQFYKMPKGLELIINNDSSQCNVEVFSETDSAFTRSHKIWINKFKKILESIPKTPEFWVISNIDGLHVGKGYPNMISTTTVGVYGAQGALQDNFHEHFHFSASIEYRSVEPSEYDDREVVELSTNIGDFRYYNINQFGKSLN